MSNPENGISVVTCSERRKHARRGALWNGRLTSPTGTYDCRVLNLSPRGAKIELAALVAIHQTVTLTLDPLGAFTGIVTWRRDRCISIAISEQRTAQTRMLLPGSKPAPRS